MLDYITADYIRIMKRVPRIIGLVLYFIAMIIFMMVRFNSTTSNWTSVSFVSATNSFIIFFSLFCGLFEFLSAISDDLKAKTMQVAIGLGISRSKIIAAKMIEIALLLLTDILVIVVLLVPLAMITGVSLVGAQIIALGMALFSTWLTAVGYLCLIMPIVFYTNSVMAAILVYLPLGSGLLYNLLRLLAMNGSEFIQKLHIESWTLDNQLSVLTSHLLMGHLNLGAVLGIIIYIAIGYFLSLLLFRKKELEF